MVIIFAYWQEKGKSVWSTWYNGEERISSHKIGFSKHVVLLWRNGLSWDSNVLLMLAEQLEVSKWQMEEYGISSWILFETLSKSSI